MSGWNKWVKARSKLRSWAKFDATRALELLRMHAEHERELQAFRKTARVGILDKSSLFDRIAMTMMSRNRR